MSSTSSLCSSTDADSTVENRIPPSLRRDIERFSVFASRLRSALDANTSIPDGESMCVAVHAALEMVSESMRDLFKYPQFKTNQVILPSLQLVQSVKELKFDHPNINVDTTKVLCVIDQLESAVLNTIITKHVVVSPAPTRHATATIGRRPKQQSADSYGSPRSASLVRRHSTYQPDYEEQDEPVMECDRALAQRIDGVDIAFERTKAWSRYCKELTTFVKTRLTQEYEHSKKVSQLVEQSRQALNEEFLPMRDLFHQSFDLENEHLLKVRETQEHLNDRFIKSLESRRVDHENGRRALKTEWNKVLKSLQDAEAEHKKAQQNLITRDDTLKKARESSLRTESFTPGMTSDPLRRRKEVEKKRRNEEEALMKREEALQQVRSLDAEVRRKRRVLDKSKEKTIESLRELVYQCDQTTKACAQHYFKALSALWVGVPGRYQELADATRDYQPGQEYMAYLHNLPPHRANSQHSLLRSDKSLDDLSSHGESTSLTAYRRNALNPDDTGAIPDTRRHKKTSSAGRLFDTNELGDAALSHQFHRNSRPAKCAHCDTLSILFTVTCAQCGQNWHKNCFPKITVSCGQSSRSPSDRRTSMFGVSLQQQLESQKRDLPLILEEVIHEIQQRGLRAKGIYRTCGVKSKIEEICEMFERHTGDTEISLDTVHPMNLASVVKLYLRKLPEPLLTFDLYPEWIRFGARCATQLDESDLDELRVLIEKMPSANYATLKHLLLHLNRVSWFSDTNLMTPSNLSTVISPSLCWAPCVQEATSFIQDAQHVNRCVEVMITHAFGLFMVDKSADWSLFFSKYSLDEPNRPDDPGEIEEDEDEDDLKDDDCELDDDQMFIPQPPTPDLLKNTRKPNTECDSAEPAHSRWKDNSSEEGQPMSRPLQPRIRSMEENASFKSGDVVLDVAEGQYFLGENGGGSTRENRVQRRQSNKEYPSKDYGSSSGYTSTECARTADSPKPMSLHNADLFPGTEGDVSYV